MTPAARVQTAIGLLDQVIVAALGKGPPADRILAEWFRASRFAGSKDRRAIRELVYAAIRLCGAIPQNGRAAMLALAQSDPALLSMFDGSNYGPAPIAEGELVAEPGVAPAWLVERLAAADITGPEAAALLDRAPLDVRVNALKADRATLALPESGVPLPAPQGLRYPAGTAVETWDAHLDGLLEVQDGGSQLACAAAGAAPGETVLDLCAGAGGKTLALAAAMQNAGTLIAADTDRARLAKLTPRAVRAGALVAHTVLLDTGREAEALAPWHGRADAVLVDAPCSGTGTWRRNPEARWRLDARELERLTALQQRLLGLAATLVRPGGRVIYVVCSLLDEEAAGQADAFLAAHPGWQSGPLDLPLGTSRGAGVRLTPYHDQTDGFFIARLEKPC
jgi:16S rRNA (cytosine967-C5)-methyltransferase